MVSEKIKESASSRLGIFEMRRLWSSHEVQLQQYIHTSDVGFKDAEWAVHEEGRTLCPLVHKYFLFELD